jgi:hypothetical protein
VATAAQQYPSTLRQHQRTLSYSLQEKFITRSLPSPASIDLHNDLSHAISIVRKYDPSGYLPGMLLSTSEARAGYFGLRAFWVETGLRFGLGTNITNGIIGSNNAKYDLGTANGRLHFWKEGLDSVFSSLEDTNQQSHINDRDQGSLLCIKHPTLRLVRYLYSTPSSLLDDTILHTQQSRESLHTILNARIQDLELRQYPTVESLVSRCHDSCSGLNSLVLECAGLPPSIESSNEASEMSLATHRAGLHFGVTHGISNALRMAIVIASTTTTTTSTSAVGSEGSYNTTNTAGRIVLPQDLGEKYSLLRPRYVLSALAMGDEDCKAKLKLVVKDMVDIARDELRLGEEEMNAAQDVLNSGQQMQYKRAREAFLPVLAATTFLNRLEERDYDLTDRGLRNVSRGEQMVCSWNLLRKWCGGFF